MLSWYPTFFKKRVDQIVCRNEIWELSATNSPPPALKKKTEIQFLTKKKFNMIKPDIV